MAGVTESAETTKTNPAQKLKIDHIFTYPNKDPYDTVKWGVRDAIAGDFVQKGVEAPVHWSDSAVGIVAKLYFATIDGKRESSVKTLIARVVNKITNEGIKHKYFDEEDSFIFEAELAYLLVNQMASFNTPVWLNLGVPGRKQSCSACYLLDVEDTMFGDDSITDWWANEAKIFKSGAGSGANLSKLRGSMEKLSTGGIASGPVAYMRPADAGAGTLKSGGTSRRAAKLVCLDVDHPDLLDFVDIKVREDKRIRILMEAGINLDPSTVEGEKNLAECTSFQNANISVRLSDAFMEAVMKDDDWGFTERTTGLPVGDLLPAKDILRKIAEAAWQCADPGVMFDDTINRWHTTPSLGRINTSNPCCEVHINDNSSCNLASLNLTKFIADSREFKFKAFHQAVDIMITAMDITCSFSELPTKEIEENTRNLRQLGLGYSNLGAALMIQGMPYDSDVGREWTAAVTSLMTGRAYKRSAELSESLGDFAAYDVYNQEAMSSVLQTHMNACWVLTPSKIVDQAKQNWDEVVSLDGFRNSQVTVIAPTGTISFMMDCETTGAEPLYAPTTYKKLASGGMIEQVPSCYQEAVEQANPLVSQTAVGDNPIPYKGHLDMLVAIQPHISGAISKTVNMPNDSSVDDIYQVYVGAWQRGIKNISVYRDGSKATQVLNTTKGDDNGLGRSNIRNSSSADRSKNISSNLVPTRRRMPRERQSLTHKFEIGGHEGYITAGMHDDGTLGEIFLSGIGKEGSTLRGMLDALAVSISLGLQHGVPLETFARKFSHMRFEPEGLTGNAEIRIAKSMPDYIIRWLVSRFGEEDLQAELGILTPKIKKVKEAGPYKPSPPPQNGRVTVKGESGSACTCGALMVRTGTCFTCPACGLTTGCA